MNITKRYFRYVGRIISYPLCILRIKKLNPTLSTEELLNFSYGNFFGLIKPMQVRSEIEHLLKIIEKKKPKSVLEIGTANGGTLFLLSRTASKESSIISIDLPRGHFGGGYSKWKVPLYKSFALTTQNLHLIRGDSHKKETLKKLNSIHKNKFDLLFIDGDHTYEGVKKDFEMYSPLVRKGGFIVLHDIAPHRKKSGCEVNKFWNEIKMKHKTKEIVADWNQNWAGIGIIQF